MIAMAISCKPSILIADEPTTALDVTIQAQILDLMQDLQKETGMAIILITHDLGVVARMADEVAVMYAGKIVEHGTVEDVFYRSAHPYTLGLRAAMPTNDPEKHVQTDSIEEAQLLPEIGIFDEADLEQALKAMYNGDSGEIPEHSRLTYMINENPEVCTALLVNCRLLGAQIDWAITGAFGDNLHGPAQKLAMKLGLSEAEVGYL